MAERSSSWSRPAIRRARLRSYGLTYLRVCVDPQRWQHEQGAGPQCIPNSAKRRAKPIASDDAEMPNGVGEGGSPDRHPSALNGGNAARVAALPQFQRAKARWRPAPRGPTQPRAPAPSANLWADRRHHREARREPLSPSHGGREAKPRQAEASHHPRHAHRGARRVVRAPAAVPAPPICRAAPWTLVRERNGCRQLIRGLW